VKLPFADLAIVPLEKITRYLLNDAHPEGKTKATFFRRFGFRPEEPHMLEAELLRVARAADMREVPFAYGLKYVGMGPIDCPDGRRVEIVTVWALRYGQTPPYFVTAYPA
jgi:hypothetical protein